MPSTSMRPLALGEQADDGAQQDRLAAARSADEAQNLAAAYIERQMIEHDAIAEADNEVAHRR